MGAEEFGEAGVGLFSRCEPTVALLITPVGLILNESPSNETNKKGVGNDQLGG